MGLYNFVRGFRWAYKQRGLYSEGAHIRRGLISGINKTVLKRAIAATGNYSKL